MLVQLKMTVPPNFRKTPPFGQGPILHRGLVPEGDVRYIHGVRVTKPLRTIVDLLVSGFLFGDVLQQAITNAVDQGLLTSPKQLLNHPIIKKRKDLQTP